MTDAPRDRVEHRQLSGAEIVRFVRRCASLSNSDKRVAHAIVTSLKDGRITIDAPAIAAEIGYPAGYVQEILDLTLLPLLFDEEGRFEQIVQGLEGPTP